MKMLLVLWIGVAVGFLIGRWNRGNDCNVTISLGDAIRWIEMHGESRTEKAHMVDLLIFLTDGGENEDHKTE
jgi:hypothetical protein